MAVGRQDSWTLEELRGELQKFERELTRARLRPASIRTYVDRTDIFLRWLSSDYQPRGPVSS